MIENTFGLKISCLLHLKLELNMINSTTNREKGKDLCQVWPMPNATLSAGRVSCIALLNAC